ncbi:MAG: hypothetical protein IPN94_12980 [Sphingobacteriales bacterium]|nr:hypothetical protein [Sphingobacteriales bacterium]
MDIAAGFVDNQAQASGNPPTGSPVTDLSDLSNSCTSRSNSTNDPTNTPPLLPLLAL